MAYIDKPTIPLRQRKRLTYKDKSGRKYRSLNVYYFDEDGNELGFSSPITPHGKINDSTAGRKWSDELKQRLL